MNDTVERRVELTLPMIPDIEITAVKAAGDLARELGMNGNAIDEMSHAIIEACINAREHACCADQRIYLTFLGSTTDGDGTRMEIWITDHGQGFDPEKARAHEHHAAGAPQKRGWGLRIIEAHMDEVEIVSGGGGTTIHMVKYGERTSI
ncbi:MAG: ATP-binding protein [Thermoanaerobaculia bacterium]